MDLIEQGNVYYGFRSDKYPEVCCYAVIISARCDIANNKISKLYYLTAVDAKDWFCTKAGFDLVYAAAIKENLKNQLSNFEINIDILLKFPEEVALKVITGNCPEKRRRDLEKIIETYQMAHKAFSDNTTFLQRKNIAATINSGKGKHAVTFLKKISSGETNHFQFIPKSAYTEKNDKVNGLIVDLQEIGILSLDDAKKITGEGIDYQCLPVNCEEEANRLKRCYWLNDESDFVMLEGIVKSPWCELLLQRFALDYIRVGVDGSTENDYTNLISLIGKD